MAVGIVNFLANHILDHLRGGTAWTQPAGIFVKLHVGDPGAAAAANPAGNTTRQAAVFGTAASAGVIANTAQVQWTAVSTTETYSHASLWDAVTAGNPLWTGPLGTPTAVTSGGTFTMAVGQITISLTEAA